MTEFTLLQEVFVESGENGEVIKLYLTPEEAAKASTDNAFALNLINRKCVRQRDVATFENRKINEVSNTISTKEVLSPASSCISESLCPGNSVQRSDDSMTESDKTAFMWPSKYIYLLLEKYEERINDFSSGIKRHSKIWENIANDMKKVDPMVTVSGTQCQSKMNSLKKMYRKIIDHNNISGNDRKSWQYFERMDELFGKSGWIHPKAVASDAGPSSPFNSINENENPNKGPVTKKIKSEKMLEEFIKEMKHDRQEKEKKKEERKQSILQEIKVQKEKQHKEKMDVMKKFYEAIAGKKLYD